MCLYSSSIAFSQSANENVLTETILVGASPCDYPHSMWPFACLPIIARTDFKACSFAFCGPWNLCAASLRHLPKMQVIS